MSRHRWVVIAIYGLTDAEARAVNVGADQRLDAEHRLSVDGPACLNCERVWTERTASRPCEGEVYDLRPNPNARVRQA